MPRRRRKLAKAGKVADLLDTTAAGAWKALGAAATAPGWRVVSNQGALPLRVLAASAMPTGDKGRTVLPGDTLAVPLAAGDALYVHCAVVQDVVS
jgi:hypothetical protein